MPEQNELNDFIKNQEIPRTVLHGYLVYGDPRKADPRKAHKFSMVVYLSVLALITIGLLLNARNLKEVLLFLVSFALVFSVIFYIIKKVTKANKPK